MTYANNMTADANEIVAELNVTGKAFDPDALTLRTQLQPTKKWHGGDTIGRSSRLYECNGWSIASPKKREVEDAVEVLLLLLQPHWNELVEATREQEVELSIVVYARSFIPAISIRSDQLHRIVELKASVDVDLYDLTEENDE